MNGIVEIVNDQVVVSSRQIADNFGKEHKDVLYAIREILTAENSAAKFFIESSYSSRGKTFPEFLILKTVESTLSQIRRRRARGTSGLWPSSP